MNPAVVSRRLHRGLEVDGGGGVQPAVDPPALRDQNVVDQHRDAVVARLDPQRGIQRRRGAQGDLGDARTLRQRRGHRAAGVAAVARAGRTVVTSPG